MKPEHKAWMDFLIAYAEDWDATFRSGSPNDAKTYFTQEFWYLFTAAVKAHAEQRVLTRQEAFRAMRTVRNEDTLAKRIEVAEDDGYIIKSTSETSRREAKIEPDEKLLKKMDEHLERTFQKMLGLAREHFEQQRPRKIKNKPKNSVGSS